MANPDRLEQHLSNMSIEELTALCDLHFDGAFVFDQGPGMPPRVVKEEMQVVWDIQREIADRIPDTYPLKRLMVRVGELARPKRTDPDTKL